MYISSLPDRLGQLSKLQMPLEVQITKLRVLPRQALQQNDAWNDAEQNRGTTPLRADASRIQIATIQMHSLARIIRMHVHAPGTHAFNSP